MWGKKEKVKEDIRFVDLMNAYGSQDDIERLGNLKENIGSYIHNVNNLILSIIGYAQYSMEIDDVNEIRESLRAISKLGLDSKKSTNNMKNILDGTLKSQKDIYKFDNIVNDSIGMIRGKIKNALLGDVENLKILINLNSDKYIYANECDLRHSIVNIMLNGIDAMNNNGVLTIRTYDKDDNIILEISDTGSGIDEEKCDEIFKPFYTTKGSNGIGLGLCIVKKVFTEYNGKIDVRSKVGEGTKFSISLPSIGFKEEIEDSELEGFYII